MTPQQLRNDYINGLLKLPRQEVIAEVRQFLIDAMDILEQSSEELQVIAAYNALESAAYDQAILLSTIIEATAK